MHVTEASGMGKSCILLGTIVLGLRGIVLVVGGATGVASERLLEASPVSP